MGEKGDFGRNQSLMVGEGKQEGEIFVDLRNNGFFIVVVGDCTSGAYAMKVLYRSCHVTLPRAPA